MYLTIFLDANRYEFVTSLHLNLAAAEAAYEDLLREFVLEDGEPLPPKADWHAACDRCGENPHIFRIESDGELGEEIFLGNSEAATA